MVKNNNKPFANFKEMSNDKDIQTKLKYAADNPLSLEAKDLLNKLQKSIIFFG